MRKIHGRGCSKCSKPLNFTEKNWYVTPSGAYCVKCWFSRDMLRLKEPKTAREVL